PVNRTRRGATHRTNRHPPNPATPSLLDPRPPAFLVHPPRPAPNLGTRRTQTPRLGPTPTLGTHAPLRRPLLHQKPPLQHHPHRPSRPHARAPDPPPPPAPPRPARGHLEGEPSATAAVSLTRTLDDIGWLATAGAQLANTAAAKARERQQAPRDEPRHQQAS